MEPFTRSRSAAGRETNETLTCTAGADAEQPAMSRGTAVGVRAAVAVSRILRIMRTLISSQSAVTCGAASEVRPGAHQVGVNNNKQTGDAVCPAYQRARCRCTRTPNTVNYVADLLRAHLKAIGSR